MPVSTFGGHEEDHENPHGSSVADSDPLNMQLGHNTVSVLCVNVYIFKRHWQKVWKSKNKLRCQVFMVAKIKIIFSPHKFVWAPVVSIFTSLKIEAVGTSETLVNTQPTS